MTTLPKIKTLPLSGTTGSISALNRNGMSQLSYLQWLNGVLHYNAVGLIKCRLTIPSYNKDH